MTDLPTPVAPAAPPAIREPTPFDLAKLAHEIACEMHDVQSVLDRYKLTDADYTALKANPYFARVLEDAIIEWNAARNTGKRIQLKSAIAVEDALHILGARMKSTTENLRDVVETGKLFAKMAGIGEQGENRGSGEKITISINLGGGEKISLERDITPTEPLGTGLAALSTNSKEDRDEPSVSRVSKRTTGAEPI